MLITPAALNKARDRLEDALSDDAHQARMEYMQLEQATWDYMAPRAAYTVALSKAAAGRNRYCDVLALDTTRYGSCIALGCFYKYCQCVLPGWPLVPWTLCVLMAY